MKFTDIPQLTSDGEWECSYSIPRFVAVIEEWVRDEVLILNPDFQRGHVWTEEQQIKYVEFVLRGGKTARVVYLNHPTWRGGSCEYNEFVCVDGLQRITALSNFVHNKIKAFDHYYNEFEGMPRVLNDMRINVNELKSRREVLQWYVDFNSGGAVHTKEEIDRVKALIEAEPK